MASWRRILRNGSTPGEPLKVLIVDDEEAVRQFVSRVLASAGMTTWCAADGPEALRIASAVGRLDLLLTDLMMPVMAGDELARRLRLGDPDLKILYLTGFSDRLFADRAALWDGEAFLDKPCTVKGLLEAVRLAAARPVEAVCVSGAVPRTGGG
jgi:two-component system cell cycle sensor histidine kinase/response regulator CckA